MARGEHPEPAAQHRQGRLGRLPPPRRAGPRAERAERQDLWDRLGETRFVAFVYLSEARAARQFGVLADHFAGHGTLGPLFAEIGKDERFHVAYSGQLLDAWRAAGRAREIDRALHRVKLSGAWGVWRRGGRRIGDRVVRLVMALLFLTVVAPFGLFARCRPAGWRGAPVSLRTVADFRRQYTPTDTTPPADPRERSDVREEG